jgi:ribosomal protein S18 acetylase RimI-like enzyme
MGTEYELRDFGMEDMPRAAELAAQAWAITASVVGHEHLPRLMQIYVELSLLGTTWKKALIDMNGTVAGFLFGGVHKEIGLKAKLKALKYLFGLYRKIIRGEVGPIKNPHEFIRKFLGTQKILQQQSPKADAEIQLFVVDAAYRGQGLGRRLMDAFIKSLQEKGGKSVKLYSDPLSTWQFYESYGFTRCAEFMDPMNSYITKKPTEGYIYYMEVS